jgi:hypothetical protein
MMARSRPMSSALGRRRARSRDPLVTTEARLSEARRTLRGNHHHYHYYYHRHRHHHRRTIYQAALSRQQEQQQQ